MYEYLSPTDITIKLANIKNKEPYTLYIGRENKYLNLPRSKFCNPNPLKREKDREQNLIDYEIYARNNPEIMNSLHELENQTLGCYCVNEHYPNKLCHGHILIKLWIERYC